VTIRSLPFPLEVQIVDGHGQVLAERAPAAIWPNHGGMTGEGVSYTHSCEIPIEYRDALEGTNKKVLDGNITFRVMEILPQIFLGYCVVMLRRMTAGG
jgi:hypothetical protein